VAHILLAGAPVFLYTFQRRRALRKTRPSMWLSIVAGLFIMMTSVVAYTTTQPRGGPEVFAAFCAGCHGAALQGGDGPALAGAGFQATWRDAAALYAFTAQQMPRNAPGALRREQSVAVVTYLLQQNGLGASE